MPPMPIFHICQLAKVLPIVKEMVKQHSELLFSNHPHWSFICKHPVTFWCISYNYYPHCNMGKAMKKSVSCSKVDIHPCKLMLDNQDAVISQSTESNHIHRKYSLCKGGWEVVIFYIYFFCFCFSVHSTKKLLKMWWPIRITTMGNVDRRLPMSIAFGLFPFAAVRMKIVSERSSFLRNSIFVGLPLGTLKKRKSKSFFTFSGRLGGS